ncbi:MAG TPA: hypothetical protein VFX86_03175 [Candidatus Saccharimonadales bacterium]|nr:hypothetical protein [Candidatus Saccharimonadales bacterium]
MSNKDLQEDNRGFGHILILFILAVLVVAVGYLAYTRIKPKTYSDQAPIQTHVTDPATIKPELTYKGAYNGKLYLTGEKVGESAPWATWAQNLDRNGVATAIAYFSIEDKGDAGQVEQIIKDFPGRIVPFYSTGVGGEEEGELAQKDKLVGIYKSSYKGFLKGIGEVEIQDWPMPHNDSRVLELFQFAADKKMHVMFHVRPGQTEAVGEIAKRFASTTFLIHLFANDFERESNDIIKLLKENPNITYTIDADHLMFDRSGHEPIGLLYKYQDELDDDIEPSEKSVKASSAKFNADFDRLEKTLRLEAIRRFKPLVEAVPDQVTVGTELNLAYGYEPESFDRIIKHLRFFIAAFDEPTRAKLSHDNALELFGSGTRLN